MILVNIVISIMQKLLVGHITNNKKNIYTKQFFFILVIVFSFSHF